MSQLHVLPGCLLLMAMGCAGVRPVFSPEALSYQVLEEVSFKNTTEGAETYHWDFGDGDTSSAFEPVHRYRRSGEYGVTLTAFSGKKSKQITRIMEIKPPSTCLVEISTDFGTMIVQLFDNTPLHRDNFLKLAEEGFYDGLLFHRVMNGFMIQGGDPDSKRALPGSLLGRGGPGYQIDAEFDESHIHIKGALAAARQPDNVNPEKRSSGSQFYIVHGGLIQPRELEAYEVHNDIQYSPEQRQSYQDVGGTPQLDMGYTVFGQVVDGIEVIDRIAGVRTDARHRPQEDVAMKVQVIK